MAKEYARIPTTDAEVEATEKSTKALEAAPIYLTGHVFPTQKRCCKGRRALFALFMGVLMTFFTISTIRLVSHGGCPFSGFKHHPHHGRPAAPSEAPQGLQMETTGGQLFPVNAAPGTQTEMDMIVLSDPDHPIPDIALQALASAKLRALRNAGYNVSSVNMAVVPQDKDHKYTMKQAYEIGMDAINKAKALSQGLEMKMKMMADRAHDVLNQLLDQFKKQK